MSNFWVGCINTVVLGMTANHAPQSTVFGHRFAAGLASASQLDVLHFTKPGVPDKPNPTPHLVAHPLGSSCTQLPDMPCTPFSK